MLISAEDLKKYTLIPSTVSADRLNVHIDKAETFDLKPFLGREFYYKMVTLLEAYATSLAANSSYTATADQQLMLDLFEGKTYNNSRGNTIIYPGLRKGIALMAFARYTKWDKFRSTNTGVVKKRHEHSDPIDSSEEASQVTQARSEVNAILAEVVSFLTDNKSSYPLWKYSYANRTMRQPGPRISAIDIYSVSPRHSQGNINKFLD